MSKICAKENCINVIPKFYITEDGKKHWTQRRKFCFECSPYGVHNTKNLNSKKDNGQTGTCAECGNPSQKCHSKCCVCYFRDKKIAKSKKVYDMIGYDCWICGYDRGLKAQSVLDFHHVYPENKMFNLSTREFVGYAWERVWTEMQKCVSICCRCHREYHAGLISDSEVKKVYEERWEKILTKEKEIL